MLKIRLQRVGRAHEPSYRLVLTDSKNSTKSGKFLEVLGNYDSRAGEKLSFNADRIKYWIKSGAQVTTTVHNLLISQKIIEGKKINALPKKKPIKKESEAPAAGVEAEASLDSGVKSSEVVEEVPEKTEENTPTA